MWNWVHYIISQCLGYLHTESDLDCNILWSICVYFVFYSYCIYVVLLSSQWSGPKAIEAWSLGLLSFSALTLLVGSFDP